MLSRLLYSILISKGKRIITEVESITKEPMKHNLSTLFSVLEKNKNTEYGRRYNFAKIGTVEDFKRHVPFSNYDTYAPFIEEMKKGGTNYITKDPPVHFAATSGSVANPKAIPVAQETIDIYKEYTSTFGFAVLSNALKGRWAKGKVLNLTEVKTSSTPCKIPYGSISGATINSVKNLLPSLFTTPLECVFSNEKFDSIYVHLRFALVYRDLSGIAAAFMSGVTDIIRYLNGNWQLLVDDIEKGTINSDIHLPDEMRSCLLKKIKPNPKRAAEIRKELQKGFGDAVLNRLWPKLSFVYAIGSGGFAAYTEIVRKYVSDETKMYFSFFAASEAMMAVCTEIESMKYALLPQSAFFEFIPLEHCYDNDPPTLTMDQIKVGEKYEIVLTSLSGFYRYRIQDVVEVVGMHNNTPEIQFAFRLNQMVNMAGEKTNDSHFRWAVQQCAEAFGCAISEYSVFPKEEPLPGRYVVLLETDNPQKLKSRINELSKMLEKKLSEANPSFGAKIASQLLGSVETNIVQEETYALYRDLMVMRGISANQIKPIRIIDTPEKERFFFSLLDKE